LAVGLEMMSVRCLFVTFFKTDLVPNPKKKKKDWSREQLEKHNKEIQSLLGNLFLRITSEKIQSRLERRPIRLREIYEYKTLPFCVLLIDALRRMLEMFRECMNAFELGDALGGIIDVLRMVKFSFKK
jgi:methionyl-tRNA synthetase